jgi:hypothetical protein
LQQQEALIKVLLLSPTMKSLSWLFSSWGTLLIH